MVWKMQCPRDFVLQLWLSLLEGKLGRLLANFRAISILLSSHNPSPLGGEQIKKSEPEIEKK
jgi:hypothetical protein